MASCKPQILTFYGTFCLPIVPLAMLTGFLVSLILPVALSFFVSAMESAFFNLLPELMKYLLSWVTPPCLFVFLNGIILVLTASSGMLSSSAPTSGSSDFHANLLGSPKQVSRPLMEDLSSAAIPCTNLQGKMRNQSTTALMVDLPPLSINRPCAAFDARGTDQVEEGKFYDAEEEKEEGEGEGEGEGEEEEEEEVNPCKFSKLAMESRSLSFSYAESRINEEEEDDEGDGYGDAWSSSSRYPKHAMLSKTLSFFCREEGDFEQMESRSLPTSPHFMQELKAHSIKRSLSVDSASFHSNQGASLPSAESLSDEAFRKRVEDFISKMNAQLKNEAK